MALGQQRPGAPTEDDDLSTLLAQADQILTGTARPDDDVDSLIAEADRILGSTLTTTPSPSFH